MPGKVLSRAWLLLINDGAGGFVPIAGMTGRGLEHGQERIDATTPDATTPEGKMWRETLPGVTTVNANGEYRLVDNSAAVARLQAVLAQDDHSDLFQIVMAGWGTYEGGFSIQVSFGDDGTITGSIALESNGEIAFTPAPVA